MATATCSITRSSCTAAAFPTATITTTRRCLWRCLAVARASCRATVTSACQMARGWAEQAGCGNRELRQQQRNSAAVTGKVVVSVAVAIATLMAGAAGAADPARSAKAVAATHASIVEAARKQDWPAVQAMAQSQRGDLNAVADEGSTALHFAVAAGQVDVVQSLLSAGADITKRNLAGV